MVTKEKMKQYRQTYHLKHPERERIRQRNWILANPEKWLAITRKSSQKRKESGKQKQYALDHKEHITFLHKRRTANEKLDILAHYCNGKPECARCGFNDIRALQIDHINGGGTSHRKHLGSLGGSHFYRWLKLNKYPKGYQVLCANCNWIKRAEMNESDTWNKYNLNQFPP